MFTGAKALGYLALRDLLANEPELADRNVYVSILGSHFKPTEWLLPASKQNALTVQFDDVDYKLLEELRKVPDQGENDWHYVVFTPEMADAIVDFVIRWHEHPQPFCFVAQCTYGVNRSGAVVEFVREIANLDPVQFAVTNPEIEPNPLVLDMLRAAYERRVG